MIQAGDGVLVAVSGGPDSVALVHLLHHLAPTLGIRLQIAHLNHGLRGEEAEEDARFVQRLGESLGLAVTVGKAELRSSAGHGSLQEAARKARYRFLREVAERQGASRIAVGHHQDDQAETVLMRLLRGSGVEGLAGMAPVRQLVAGSAITVIRPLLEVSRRELHGYLHRHHLPFRQDTSNLQPRYLRNRIRLELMPLLEAGYNPRLSVQLAALARQFRADAQWLRAQAEAAFRDLAHPQAGDLAQDGRGREVALDWSRAAALPEALTARVLRLAYERVAGNLRSLEQRHIEALLRLMDSSEGSASLYLPGGVAARREYRRLLFTPLGEAPPAAEVALKVPGYTGLPGCEQGVQAEIVNAPSAAGEDGPRDRDYARFDFDQLEATGYNLAVRRRRPGDHLLPLGLNGTRKVQDLLVDAKIGRFERECVPLVVAGPEVLWVAGVRQSRLYPVGGSTRRILILRLLARGRVHCFKG